MATRFDRGRRASETTRVRVKAVKRFSERVAGSLVVGNPDHERGRFIRVTEEQAQILEDRKLVTRKGVSQTAGDGGPADDEGEGRGVGGGTTGTSDSNPDGAAPGGASGNDPSAQASRERRTAGKPKAGDTAATKPRGGRRPKREKAASTDAPTGGDETIASTGHPGTAGAHDTSGEQHHEDGIGADDPDAAPTGG